MSYTDKLNECFKMAMTSPQDINLAVEIAEKLKGVTVVSLDPVVQAITERLDEMVYQVEQDKAHCESPYHFEWGGKGFEIRIL